VTGQWNSRISQAGVCVCVCVRAHASRYVTSNRNKLSRSGTWGNQGMYVSNGLDFLFFFFFLFRITPRAYGGSQARGLIRATAVGLHHGLWQQPILNPPRARPGIEPATSWFLDRFVSAAPQRELPNGLDFDMEAGGSFLGTMMLRQGPWQGAGRPAAGAGA